MTKACFGRRPPAAVRAVVGGALGALRPAAAAPQAAGLPQQTDPAEDQAAGGGRCPLKPPSSSTHRMESMLN